MSRTPNLNDLQLILLASANQRDDGSILPTPESLRDQQERVSKALPQLLRHKLILEAPVTVRSQVWREQDGQLTGLVISEKGREAIAAGTPQEPGKEASDEPSASAAPVARHGDAAPSSPRPGSKIDAVLGLLQRDDGATLDEMVQSTGWLPHTTRAALTGLRKKGHAIAKSSRDGVTVYRIAQETA